MSGIKTAAARTQLANTRDNLDNQSNAAAKTKHGSLVQS
jgi:hypothetical protein